MHVLEKMEMIMFQPALIYNRFHCFIYGTYSSHVILSYACFGFLITFYLFWKYVFILFPMTDKPEWEMLSEINSESEIEPEIISDSEIELISDPDYVQPNNYTSKLRKRQRNSI